MTSNWLPSTDPKQNRRTGKLLEELGELAAVVARIGIQGIDEIDPGSGDTNRLRLEKEIADVLCQIELTTRFFDLDIEYIVGRVNRKTQQMTEWEQLATATDRKETK